MLLDQLLLSSVGQPVTVTPEIDYAADQCGWVPGQPVFRGEFGGEEVVVQVRRILNGYRLSHRGVVTDAHVFTRREAELARLMPAKKVADTSKKLLCPMPGLVVAIVTGQWYLKQIYRVAYFPIAGTIWILGLNSAHGRVAAEETAQAREFGVISIALGGIGGRPGVMVICSSVATVRVTVGAGPAPRCRQPPPVPPSHQSHPAPI